MVEKLTSNEKDQSSSALPSDLFNEEQKKDFKAVLEELKHLYSFNLGVHERNETFEITSRAHSIDHDLAVSAFAHAIARRYSQNLAKTSVAASLMHSYDRFKSSTADGAPAFTDADVRKWADECLLQMTPEEREAIVRAATMHDKPNKGRKAEVPTIADILADADKLANLMLYTMVRSGQYLPNKPTLRLGNINMMTPGANYKRHNVAFDDIHGMKEWLDDKAWFVTPEAVRIAESLEGPFMAFIKIAEKQFESLGLDAVPARKL